MSMILMLYDLIFFPFGIPRFFLGLLFGSWKGMSHKIRDGYDDGWESSDCEDSESDCSDSESDCSDSDSDDCLSKYSRSSRRSRSRRKYKFRSKSARCPSRSRSRHHARRTNSARCPRRYSRNRYSRKSRSEKCRNRDNLSYLLLDSLFESVLGEVTCNNWYKKKIKDCERYKQKITKKHRKNINKNRIKHMLCAKKRAEDILLKSLRKSIK